MYNDTHIWKSAFERADDQYDNYRSRLHHAFLAFRERVGQLIQTIPAEIPGLTVHDLSHLDAIWEMCDILTGDNHGFNPAEVFVLGGAILLHDSAMTICAYPGGIEEIKQTPEYSDAFAQFQSHTPASPFQSHVKHDQEAELFAVSEALRIKHASKSEDLATQKWISPIDNSEVYLIEDSDLRDHFGRAIGRIAHSHHWDINEIPKKLGTTLGALSGLHKDWTVDQVKIALLLRCADAMQIDDRRAPRFLSSVRAIGPTSMEHWRFQNLLTVPHREDQKLVYTSKRPFAVTEAPAWNLCFDTLQMIDTELRKANDLHLQKNLPHFQATGVAGIGSPDALSKYIEVKDWMPLPLNLKVSNVPHLAKTLGGQDLYNSQYAPLRELIQNAADAIEARTLMDDDFSLEDGLISIKFIDNQSDIILQIEDNGIGMSERILTTVLLDFGFSFWKSSTARSEFPGIQKNVDNFRGRYGIGFFSVFMWSGEVMVSSRRFNEGVSNSKVLDFQKGLDSRPLLRPATMTERSTKWNTRVQLKLSREFLLPPQAKNSQHRDMYFSKYYITNNDPSSWLNVIKLLCGALKIKVNLEYLGRIDSCSLPDWKNCSASLFFDFFNPTIFQFKSTDNNPYLNTITNLSNSSSMGGRCLICPTPNNRGTARVAVYDKGIFVNFANFHSTYGVIEASTTNAARDKYTELRLSNDREWIKAAITKGFSLCRNIGEKISLQNIGYAHGYLDENQPLFIKNRELISLSELYRTVSKEKFFSITLKETAGGFGWQPPEKISIILGLVVDPTITHSLIHFEAAIGTDSNIEPHINQPQSLFFSILHNVRSLIGDSAKIQFEFSNEGLAYKNGYLKIFLDPKD